MNFHQIYEALLAGKTLQLEFDTIEEVNVLKASLYRFKRRQDIQLVSIGILQEEEVQKLSMKVQTQMHEVGLAAFQVTLSLKDKLTTRQYKVTIIEDTPGEDDGELS